MKVKVFQIWSYLLFGEVYASSVLDEFFWAQAAWIHFWRNKRAPYCGLWSMLVSALLMFASSLVASTPVLMVEKEASTNIVSSTNLLSKSSMSSNKSSMLSTNRLSRPSTVLADLREKALNWADRIESMAKQQEKQEREAKKLDKEDWNNLNHTWQGVDKENSTVTSVLGPLLKNYIDLVPSISGCTGALLGCHISVLLPVSWIFFNFLYFIQILVSIITFRLSYLCICQFPGHWAQQLSSSLSGEVYYWGVWVML